MQHNPQKNVLHRIATVEHVAASQGREVEAARTLLAEAQKKMYAARLKRKTPYVDKTVYSGWNGLCISAYLAAGRALNRPDVTAFALKSLDRVLREAWSDETGLAHVVAYGEGGSAARVAGVLEDYAFVAAAALDAWESSGEVRYFDAAKQITDRMLELFCDVDADGKSHGFFDTGKGSAGVGALSTRRKPLQDSPTPSGNGAAANALLRLHALTDEDLYRTRAMETLETFAGVVEHFGLYVASYGLALRRAVTAPVQVCVLGDDAAADELMVAAMMRFAANKSVVRLRWDQLAALPPALAKTLSNLAQGSSVAVVCTGSSCLPPVSTPRALFAALSD
jgi:uncharacterized protein YyaL (SSP411 family)